MAETTVIRARLLAAHGITGLFTTRCGGISPVPFDSLNFGFGLGDSDDNLQRNMQRLIDMTPLPSTPHQAIQVHGRDILYCHSAGHTHTDDADILITDQPDQAVAVRTADCLPVLLADPTTGIVAAVHAGWRGTATRVAAYAVEAMLERGAKKHHLLASLGPCIGPCCFRIGDQAAQALADSAPLADHCISRKGSAIHADLAAINRLQLLACGLAEQHVESMHACTSCDDKHFFSYRRDGRHSGRQLAVVATASAT